jgi:tetratricopeptide (TPR) repeat protein
MAPLSSGAPPPERLATVHDDLSGFMQFLAGELSWRLGEATHEQLTSCLRSWAGTMDRREFLRALGWAATAAAAAPPLYGVGADELARLERVVAGPHRVDGTVIATIEAVLSAARRLDDALGAQAALDTVLTQQSLTRLLLAECPQHLRPRLLESYSKLSSGAGWLFFDLNHADRAWHHHQLARNAAHEAGNADLGAFALSRMSCLAGWRGRRTEAVSLSEAAQRAAATTGDMRLRAYVEAEAALAYANDHQGDACLGALDRAEAHLAQSGRDVPPDSVAYFYDGEELTYGRSRCHLRIGDPQQTLATIRPALARMGGDRVRPRDLALTKLDLGKAYIAAGQPDEGAAVTAEVAELAMQNRSPRLAREIRATRTEMEPWSDRVAVKELDDRLAAYGVG